MIEAGQLDLQKFQSFVHTLISKRDEAIAGRRSSGIEADWLEDEEYYQSIDEGNREFVRSWVASIKRGSTTKAEPTGQRSTVFLNITRPYCDAAAARLADMLLPVDDECFAIKRTPVAQINIATLQELTALGIDVVQLQLQVEAEAERSAAAMQTQISDHLVESHWHGEVRTVIEDAARIGCGVLKGPFPKRMVAKKWLNQDGTPELVTATDIKPASSRIDPWNFFPDPACGEDIHDGGYVWERAYVTAKQLRECALMPGYNVAEVLKALQDGPKNLTSREAADGSYIPIDNMYEMWTFYGAITAEDAKATQLAFEDELSTISVLAVLVNDRLIKISLNPMDTGEYPYDVLAWARRPGVPWGTGIARHIRTPQRMLNAACRAMMDNAGMIAAPQEVVGNGVTPDDQRYEIRGRKLWHADPDVMDITKSFFCYTPPSHIQDFQLIIEFARSIAEQTTGMPMLLQGQQPEGKAGDTLGGMQLLQNNATGVLRRLAKRFDDHLTGPHIRRYYHWLMQYSPRDDIKGDFQVDVRASSALIERDSQKQFMLASMQFATNPAYGIDPYRLFSELAKADRMDPKRIQYEENDFLKRAGKPSMIDQAKAALMEAQAKLAEAKTLSTKVEAMYESIQAAEATATLPQVMPAADEILKASGYQPPNPPGVDPNLNAGEPIPEQPEGGVTINPIKNIKTGMEFTPAVPGTPPTSKPPADATTGVQAGIEGGQP